MKLVCLGLNHETAPVEVRERFALSEGKLREEVESLIMSDGIHEAVVLSTCNRTEYYVVLDHPNQLEEWVCQKREFSGNRDGLFYQYELRDAAQHLCRVASGMNSMVLGETEIFGQVKKAYSIALESKATGSLLNKLFQRSFTVGKRVRNQTSIQEGATSVAGASVELAEQVFGQLKGSAVMVVGAGEMSRQAAQALQSRGATSVFVTNRSYDKAVELAELMSGKAIHFDDWEPTMEHIDVLISSTGAPHFVVKPQHVEAVRRKRKFRPLIMVDIAVPRDIDPAVAEIEEVYLYDIDTLQAMANRARDQREKQLVICEEIINEELIKAALPGLT